MFLWSNVVNHIIWPLLLTIWHPNWKESYENELRSDRFYREKGQGDLVSKGWKKWASILAVKAKHILGYSSSELATKSETEEMLFGVHADTSETPNLYRGI